MADLPLADKMNVQGSNEWKYPLFGCFGDIKLCMLAWCVPCYVQGKNAEHFGEDCLFHGIVGLFGIGFGGITRWRIRQEKGIKGTMFWDTMIEGFCPCCAAVQDAREIGWGLPEAVANLGKKDQAPEMARE